jgi:hypothetical protein
MQTLEMWWTPLKLFSEFGTTVFTLKWLL